MKTLSTLSPTVKYGLHCIGIWPGIPFPMLYKFYWIVSTIIFQGFQYSYIIQHFKSQSFVELVDNLSIGVAITQTNINVLVSWINHRILCDMLSTIEEECKKYAFIDKTGLILKTIHVSYRLTTSIILLYVMVAIIHIIGNATSAHSNETYSLILKMDLPFEINKSPNYELVLTAQIFHQTYTAFTFSVYSALILMVVLHVGCQIDILCQTIIDVPLRDKKQLEFFISRHQDIIVFTEKIEQFFTYMALSQLLSNILITCCLGFLIIMSISGDAGLSVFFKSVLFYVALWIEAYVYCFAGEYLNTKSKLICETAYKCLWYNLYPSESKLLIIVILRAQKGFTLTFGKFSNLSLENFTEILKASASYMSVLLAMS
ncbi:uncharacterized protein LOC100884046 [Megachile rotundata]|uniref:uncharacterized protein LOC100884046 n=1 Tax=Megachile rotundata TaxID=143995 RepID=UPI003FD584FB